ncbi:MAG: hypothetical protein L6Q97_01325 [Thermoanaerobaculia bacterium]|nr:hypothetical protein [Thermoanaerobaculia bacterium]
MKSLILLSMIYWIQTVALSAQSAYEIWFAAGSVTHHGLIRAGENGKVWQMRVKYTDAGCRCERLIEQQMQAEKTNLGVRLSGHSVRDVISNRLTRDYAADRLYLYYDREGNVWSQYLDEQGISGKAVLKPLDAAGQAEKMRAFGW